MWNLNVEQLYDTMVDGNEVVNFLDCGWKRRRLIIISEFINMSTWKQRIDVFRGKSQILISLFPIPLQVYN